MVTDPGTFDRNTIGSMPRVDLGFGRYEVQRLIGDIFRNSLTGKGGEKRFTKAPRGKSAIERTSQYKREYGM